MMQDIYKMKFEDFIDIAASNSPTPGGGNVSAAVATLGATMVCMVGNLTLSNKKYNEYHEVSRKLVTDMMDIIERLKKLTMEDMKAFDAYMAVFRMPKSTDEEKKTRFETMQLAAKKATLVPLDICKVCLDILLKSDEISKYGNKMAISDVGVGAAVARAALRSCMLSVDINLPTIKDNDFVKSVIDKKNHLLVKAEELEISALSRVKRKMG